MIQQSDPQVVYVPDYNPTVVYGAPAYPLPAGCVSATGILRGGSGSFLRRWNGNGCNDVGWLGL